MARRRVRLPAWIVPVIVAAIFILYFTADLRGSPGTVPEGELAVHFIDVGQGDAALLVTSDSAVMIDTGPGSSRGSTLEYVRGHTEKLDLMILTHPHEDHIGGAADVLRNIPTAKVIMPDAVTDTRTFSNVLDAVEESGADTALAAPGDVYELGGMRITILAPVSSEYEDMNNYSVVCRVEYGSRSFVFTGDAERQSELEIIGRYGASALRCDVLKVGHHGSDTSSSAEFLGVLRPRIAVISAGKDNDYGHPHRASLRRLEKAGVEKIYRTDELGTVVLVCDGTEITAE